MNSLQSFLQSCRDRESRATKGPWKCHARKDGMETYLEDEEGCSIAEAHGFWGGIEGEASDRTNFMFIAFSRNNWDKLLKIIEHWESYFQDILLDSTCCAGSANARLALDLADRIVGEE